MRASPVKRADRCRAALGALALALLVIAGFAEPAAAQRSERGQDQRPNIVLIMVDDQPASTVRPDLMPALHRHLARRGTTFTDYIVTTPLCCPSRATTITGQYGHNNGVLRNQYGDLLQKANVLPVWLRQAGYRTAHVGRWLNRYDEFARRPREVAPGWDLWFSQLEPRRYLRWRASRNGTVERYENRPRHHLTRVTNEVAASWTRRMARQSKPFFLHLAYFAPHGGGGRQNSPCGAPRLPVPMQRDVGAFAELPLPRPPSFNADVSEKPHRVRSEPEMDEETIEWVTRRYRCAAESMLGVDRGIAWIVRMLRRMRQLHRTVFIYTSDNGFFYGEHRIPFGKPHPYEENIRMPLTISVPPAFTGRAPRLPETDAPAANIDLAPTILELADAPPCRGRPPRRKCRTLDGRSLMPLIEQREGHPSSRAFAIEHSTCAFRGIRRDRNVYVETGPWVPPVDGRCETPEVEHYDLAADPYQLENLAPAPEGSPTEALQGELRRRMGELRLCSGIQGRDPPSSYGFWCE